MTELKNNRMRVILFCAIALGIVVRLTLRHTTALWEDEVIAATQAIQPFLQVIVTVAVHDIHLLLRFWSLLGKSDLWFIVNSIFFSLAAIPSIFLVQRKFAGPKARLAAAAITAVLRRCRPNVGPLHLVQSFARSALTISLYE